MRRDAARCGGPKRSQAQALSSPGALKLRRSQAQVLPSAPIRPQAAALHMLADGALRQLVCRFGERPVLVRRAVAAQRGEPPGWPKPATSRRATLSRQRSARPAAASCRTCRGGFYLSGTEGSAEQAGGLLHRLVGGAWAGSAARAAMLTLLRHSRSSAVQSSASSSWRVARPRAGDGKCGEGSRRRVCTRPPCNLPGRRGGSNLPRRDAGKRAGRGGRVLPRTRK